MFSDSHFKMIEFYIFGCYIYIYFFTFKLKIVVPYDIFIIVLCFNLHYSYNSFKIAIPICLLKTRLLNMS